MEELQYEEAALARIVASAAAPNQNVDRQITKALTLLRKIRGKASSEVIGVLEYEIEDANARIASGEVNPLYWLERRFRQLAEEIEDGGYGAPVR